MPDAVDTVCSNIFGFLHSNYVASGEPSQLVALVKHTHYNGSDHTVLLRFCILYTLGSALDVRSIYQNHQ